MVTGAGERYTGGVGATVGTANGTCHVLFAFDVGFQVDLQAAERRLATQTTPGFRHKLRVPAGADAGTLPLRMARPVQAVSLGEHRTEDQVELAVYGFGSICVTYSIALRDLPVQELVRLSTRLYDNAVLIEDARRRAEELLAILGDAVQEPRLSQVVEDYVVYDLRPPGGGAGAWTEDPELIARVLRAEEGRLSAEEQEGTRAGRISYAPGELVTIDWFAALLIGQEMSDERRVLELVTVELVELRHLDWILERRVDQAYDVLARTRMPSKLLTPFSRELGRIARFQADSAVLHEGVDNALKLLGDEYLARLYRLASLRFYFSEWDASIERKLATLESVYSKLADLAARRRAELLEWIIIALIAVDILLYFLPVQRGT